jgi:hypothetical protein
LISLYSNTILKNLANCTSFDAFGTDCAAMDFTFGAGDIAIAHRVNVRINPAFGAVISVAHVIGDTGAFIATVYRADA